LKKYYYPLIREDVFVDVSDEVAECLLQLHREEERIRRKIRYHKAYYSLDYNDGIERAALDALFPSPEDIMLEQEEQRLKQLKLQRIMIPRRSRGFFMCGHSPRILAAPSQAHKRPDICVGIDYLLPVNGSSGFTWGCCLPPASGSLILSSCFYVSLLNGS